MGKRVLEIPEGLEALGEAVAAMIARVQGTVAATGGGKAVDYGRVERAIADETGGIERAAHRAILQALDIDVPAVVIGGRRYTKVGQKVGRCEAPYHTVAGSWRSSGRCTGSRGNGLDSRGAGWSTRSVCARGWWSTAGCRTRRK